MSEFRALLLAKAYVPAEPVAWASWLCFNELNPLERLSPLHRVP